MNIIFCGPPLSGKTTIAKACAQAWRWKFIDTDRLIEKAYGKNCTCREIFQKEGKTFFRLLEKKCLFTLTNATKTVIATGGGTLLDEENKKFLKTLGPLLYLKVPQKTLWERMKTRGVGAYIDSNNAELSFYQLLKSRQPVYENQTISIEFL